MAEVAAAPKPGHRMGGLCGKLIGDNEPYQLQAGWTQTGGRQAEYVNADVRQEDDLRNLVDKTAARFGRLDVAVNAAEPKASPVR